MKIIGIDPSLNHIGIAWKIDDCQVQTKQLDFTNLDFKDKTERLIHVGTCLVRTLKSYALTNADVGVIEYPNFQTSERGKIAATQGYTLDLAFICGYVLSAMPNTRWFTPTPVQWKGGQPKEAIGIKFTRWTGIDYHTLSDHQFEASMMIKWGLNQL